MEYKNLWRPYSEVKTFQTEATVPLSHKRRYLLRTYLWKKKKKKKIAVKNNSTINFERWENVVNEP